MASIPWRLRLSLAMSLGFIFLAGEAIGTGQGLTGGIFRAARPLCRPTCSLPNKEGTPKVPEGGERLAQVQQPAADLQQRDSKAVQKLSPATPRVLKRMTTRVQQVAPIDPSQPPPFPGPGRQQSTPDLER
jgi:hypothetical protein